MSEPITTDRLITAYLKMREKTRDLNDEVEKVKAQMDKVETELLRRMNDQGLDQVKSADGTAFRVHKTNYTVADGGVFGGWLASKVAEDKENIGLLQMRISQKNLEAFLEANQLPPGVNTFSKISVQIRTSTK